MSTNSTGRRLSSPELPSPVAPNTTAGGSQDTSPSGPPTGSGINSHNIADAVAQEQEQEQQARPSGTDSSPAVLREGSRTGRDGSQTGSQSSRNLAAPGSSPSLSGAGGFLGFRTRSPSKSPGRATAVGVPTRPASPSVTTPGPRGKERASDTSRKEWGGADPWADERSSGSLKSLRSTPLDDTLRFSETHIKLQNKAEEARCSENITFMEQMCQYQAWPKTTPPEHRYGVLRHVMRQFISPTSNTTVNVSSETTSELLLEWTAIKAGKTDFGKLDALLEVALCEVHKILKEDFFKRFQAESREEEHKPGSVSDSRGSSVLGRAKASVQDVGATVSRFGKSFVDSLKQPRNTKSEDPRDWGDGRWPPHLVSVQERDQVLNERAAKPKITNVPDLDRALLAGDKDEASDFVHPPVVPSFMRKAMANSGAGSTKESGKATASVPAHAPGTSDSLEANCQGFLDACAKPNESAKVKLGHLQAIRLDLQAQNKQFTLDDGLSGQFLYTLAGLEETAVMDFSIMMFLVVEVQGEAVPLPTEEPPAELEAGAIHASGTFDSLNHNCHAFLDACQVGHTDEERHAWANKIEQDFINCNQQFTFDVVERDAFIGALAKLRSNKGTLLELFKAVSDIVERFVS